MVTAHLVTKKRCLWPQNHPYDGSQPRRDVRNGDDQEQQATEAMWLFSQGRKMAPPATGTQAGVASRSRQREEWKMEPFPTSRIQKAQGFRKTMITSHHLPGLTAAHPLLLR